MFLTMGSLGDWISLTGERISTTSELGVAHISPPEGDDCPLNGGACGPRPPGAAPAPPAVPSALWGGTPLLLTSRERRQAIGEKESVRPWGEAPEVGAPKARKPRVSRWATRRVVHGPPRRGARGRESPRPGIQPSGRSPASLGVEDPPAPPGAHFLAQQGIVSTPFP